MDRGLLPGLPGPGFLTMREPGRPAVAVVRRPERRRRRCLGGDVFVAPVLVGGVALVWSYPCLALVVLLVRLNHVVRFRERVALDRRGGGLRSLALTSVGPLQDVKHP